MKGRSPTIRSVTTARCRAEVDEVRVGLHEGGLHDLVGFRVVTEPAIRQRMYQGIFDTDFDKYTEDAIVLFGKAGLNTAFENLEGFPEDWKRNPEAFVKFVRGHQCNSFLEYAEYPYFSSDEIKKALSMKQAFTEMLEQMQ